MYLGYYELLGGHLCDVVCYLILIVHVVSCQVSVPSGTIPDPNCDALRSAVTQNSGGAC